MVGKIEDSRSIGFSCQCKAEFAVFCPLVAGNRLECTGISLLSIFRIVQEFHTTFVLTRLPNLVLESFRASMKMIRTVIHRQGVFHAVQSELAKGYTVGISSRNLSKTRTVSEIIHRIRISENHISHVAFLVRHHDRYNTGTDVRELHISSLRILDGVEINLLSA